MKVLLFHASHSLAAVTLVASAVTAIRAEGHSVGERFLPAFKAEPEPADKLVIALTPVEADRYKDRGLELVQTFGGKEAADKFVMIELPDNDDDLKDFDVQSIVDQVEGPATPTLLLEQAKAEAIRRGLEVTPETTLLDLERMLGLDISAATQAGDRITDQRNNLNLDDPRIGVRTSQIMPTVNGLSLERMNDEQLRAAAAELGLKVTSGMKRETIINKMTELYAKKVEAPEDSAPKSPTAGTDPLSKDLPSSETKLASLDGMDAEALKAQAEKESVDIGRMTSADSIRKAIEAKRQETAAHG